MATLPTTTFGNIGNHDAAADIDFETWANGDLETIAGADDGDYGGAGTSNPTGTVNYTVAYLMDNMPGDFVAMSALSIRLRYGLDATDPDVSWDGITARIVKNTDGTVLAAGTSGGGYQSVAGLVSNTSPQNSSVIPFSYVNTGASKSDWDDAALQITVIRSRSKGGGTTELRIYAAEVTGTYATGATYTLALGAGSISASGQALALKHAYQLPLGQGTVNVAGQALTLKHGYQLALGAGAVDVTGQPLVLTFTPTYKIMLGAGTISVAGQALTLKHGYQLALGAGNVAVSIANDPGRHWSGPIDAGTVNVTGQALGLVPPAAGPTYTLALGTGSITVTGQALVLKHGYQIALGAGSINATGQILGLVHGYQLALGAGSVNVNGQSLALVYSHLPTYSIVLGTGQINITGAESFRDFGFALGTGSVDVAGQAITLVPTTAPDYTIVLGTGYINVSVADDPSRHWSGPMDTGSINVVGQDLTLSYFPETGPDYTIALGTGLIGVTGQGLGLVRSYTLNLGYGSVTLTGQDLVFTRPARSIILGPGAIAVTGQQMGFSYSGARRLRHNWHHRWRPGPGKRLGKPTGGI